MRGKKGGEKECPRKGQRTNGDLAAIMSSDGPESDTKERDAE